MYAMEIKKKLFHGVCSIIVPPKIKLLGEGQNMEDMKEQLCREVTQISWKLARTVRMCATEGKSQGFH